MADETSYPLRTSRTNADRELPDAVTEHGDDAIRESIHATVSGEMGHREAGGYVFDDRDAGARLVVVVAKIIYHVERSSDPSLTERRSE